MKRSGRLPRTAPLPRSGLKASGIKRKPRKPSEYARIYGSKARVAWIKARPCVFCGRRPSENAHTVGGGTGYKAGYETIVPLCGPDLALDYVGCHRAYDRHLPPFDSEGPRELVKACAPRIEAAWQRHNNPEHIGPIVDRVLADLLNQVGDDA